MRGTLAELENVSRDAGIEERELPEPGPLSLSLRRGLLGRFGVGVRGRHFSRFHAFQAVDSVSVPGGTSSNV